MASKQELTELLRECRSHIWSHPSCRNRDLLSKLDAALAPEPEARTVRVRAAVAVTNHGWWSVSGGYQASDSLAAKSVQATLFDAEYIETHFIEADVPIPEPTTIQAEVTQ